MPIALSGTTRAKQKVLRDSETRMAWQAREIFKALDDTLRGVTDGIFDELYRSSLPPFRRQKRLNIAKWRRRRKTYNSRIRTTVSNGFDKIGRLAETSQKSGFKELWRFEETIFKQLYPPEFRELDLSKAKPLNLKPNYKLSPFTDKVTKEAREYEIMESDRYAVLDTVVTEAGTIFKGIVGGSQVPDELYLSFISQQLEQGLDPLTRIVTLSNEQIGILQRAMLLDIRKGYDLGWTRDRLTARFLKDAGGLTQQQIRYNTMRILRTSHQRACNVAVSNYSQMNPVVKELERVASGRPCIACFPEGTQIIEEGGRRHINKVKKGDYVLTHLGRFKKVVKTFIREYEGNLIEIKSEYETHFEATEEHPVGLWKYLKKSTGIKPITGKEFKWAKAMDLTVNIKNKLVYLFCLEGRYSYNVPEIISIRKRWYKGTVYNLEVEEDNSYCVADIYGGYAVHNCVALSGKRYPKGSVMDDHIFGLCGWLEIVKTPEELGFNVSETQRKFWNRYTERKFPTRAAEFLKLPEAMQRKVFANNALYDLWKTRKFPLERLAVKKGGVFVPVTYREALANVDKWMEAVEKIKKLSYNDWLANLSSKEIKIFQGWKKVRNYVDDIRNYQIKGMLPKFGILRTKGRLESAIRSMNEAMNRARAYKGTVYRGMKKLTPKQLNEILKQKTIILDSFTSASKNEWVARSFARDPKGRGILFRIENKTGIDITDIDGYITEGEVLLRKGARYAVTKVVDKSATEGYYIMYLGEI